MIEDAELPTAYLRAIGLVTIRWGLLESVVRECMIRLLGHDYNDGRAHVVFAHMAFPQMLDVIGAMIGELILPPNSPLARYSKEIRPLLQKAADERNRVVHQEWTPTEGGEIVRLETKARGTLKFNVTRVTLKELQDAAEFMVEAADSLWLPVDTWHKSLPQTGQ